MADTAVPEPRVLTDEVIDVLGGDRLVAAVFLTYELQPEFFEDHILAPLCGVDSRGSPAIRRYLLEEALRRLPEVLVLYDAGGLRADGPLRQRVRAVPVAWGRGVMHAKHALLLMQAADAAEPTALVLLTTSANLTRTGWWKNVEVADLERLEAGAATPIREDLLGLVALMRTLEASGARHDALDRVEAFVRDRLAPAEGLPRLWLGREPLSDFLAAHVDAAGGRLEAFAPFVDDHGAPIASLARTLRADETVVWFPLDGEGAGAALATWRDGVKAVSGASFGELGVDRRLGKGSDAERFVHAKVVRYADLAKKRTWTLAGSPNLSVRGHAGWQTGAPASNVETAMLRVAPGTGRWLAPLAPGKEPAPAAAAASEDEPARGILLRARFDWELWAAAVRLAGAPGRVHLGPSTTVTGGSARVVVDVPDGGAWIPLSASAADWLGAELETGNVIGAWGDDGVRTSVLVEEHGLVQRPSLVARALTPADILRHWSLLTEAQRAENLEKRLTLRSDDPEAPIAVGAAPAAPGPTMFDTFSGILHGFFVLRTRLERALDAGEDAAAEAWLLGLRHDSVGTLLDLVLAEEEPEAVRQVIFGLCARELVGVVRDRRPALLSAHPGPLGALEDRIAQLESAWGRIEEPPGEAPGTFRRWIEAWWAGTGEP